MDVGCDENIREYQNKIGLINFPTYQGSHLYDDIEIDTDKCLEYLLEDYKYSLTQKDNENSERIALLRVESLNWTNYLGSTKKFDE